MKHIHPGIVGGEFLEAVDNSAKGHAAFRYELLHFVKECIVDTGASVSADKPQVAQKRPSNEFFLSQQMKYPTLALGVHSHGSELSKNGRSIEAIHGLDVQEPDSAVKHLDQEAGDDAGASAVLCIARTKAIMIFQQFKVKIVAVATPPIPDGQRLLLQVSHGRARYQDGSRSCFEVALTAD